MISLRAVGRISQNSVLATSCRLTYRPLSRLLYQHQRYPISYTTRFLSLSGGREDAEKELHKSDERSHASPQPAKSYYVSVLSNSPETFESDFLNIRFPKLPLQPHRYLMVLFVTPAFIENLDLEKAFIPRVLERIFSLGTTGGQVDVLAAVVDQIPTPSRSELYLLGSNSKTGDHGSEGISMALVESSKAMPDLWSKPPQEAKFWDKQSPDQRYSLSIVLKPHDSLVERGTKGEDLIPYLVHRLQLPLASTLFQTGKTSTFFAECWKVTYLGNGHHEWAREKRVLLEQQELHLPASSPQHVTQIDLYGLKPLTPPRVVAESMGNIIRRLEVGNNTVVTAPASQELEGQIIARKSPDDTSAYQPEIWAQVIPREIWQGHPKKPLSYEEGIEQGHRLHRVLSGGGGWGNKQGLIALDANSSFFPTSNDTSLDIGDKLDYDREQRRALGEVVRPGDVVSFLRFVKPYKPIRGVFQRFDGDDSPLTIHARLQFLFGSAIPEGDDGVSLPARSERPRVQPRYLLFHNLLGALSITGASVSVDLFPSPHRTDFGAQRTGRIVETKLPPLAVVHSTHQGEILTSVKRLRGQTDDSSSSGTASIRASHGLRESPLAETSTTSSGPIIRKLKIESKGKSLPFGRNKVLPSGPNQGDLDQTEPEPVSRSTLSSANIASATRRNGDPTDGSNETDVLDGISREEAELENWRKQSEAIIRQYADTAAQDEDVRSNDYWPDDATAKQATFSIRKYSWYKPGYELRPGRRNRRTRV